MMHLWEMHLLDLNRQGLWLRGEGQKKHKCCSVIRAAGVASVHSGRGEQQSSCLRHRSCLNMVTATQLKYTSGTLAVLAHLLQGQPTDMKEQRLVRNRNPIMGPQD